MFPEHLAAQIDAAAVAHAQSITELLNRPLKSISASAGEMERESPLFFGTGNNPTLFGGAS